MRPQQLWGFQWVQETVACANDTSLTPALWTQVRHAQAIETTAFPNHCDGHYWNAKCTDEFVLVWERIMTRDAFQNITFLYIISHFYWTHFCSRRSVLIIWHMVPSKVYFLRTNQSSCCLLPAYMSLALELHPLRICQSHCLSASIY